ncbi:MAG TPA: heme lyase CcmF/NrfE family subunit [Rhodocyclaceae bacterium]|nr:heme lyase CcmF/NrfE family subunit [Rhodocyclaceae bacterium]
MIPELGQIALILALCVALVMGVLPLIGAHQGNAALMMVARPAARCLFGFVMLAFMCLTYSFIVNDFSVLYVASHSNTALPLYYRITAVWGSHEGSLLLWALLLSGWILAVSFSFRLPETFVARVLAVLGLVSTGFLAFVLFTSNPFERLLPAPLEGQDLNPLLQDPGMIIHPPMLYMGYVGFSVAFAFAIAALLSGRLDAAWARWSRPWTLAAWAFLTVGITLGSGWAYHVLGWGGWWFWDPVENASFMPWLVGTALIHSLSVTEKRGAFRSWTVLLAIGAFSLSLLGTFLVRSGVLTSVHAFAVDPRRGVFILALLVFVIGGSLLLFAWRAAKLSGGGSFDVISRDTALLTNNMLLAVVAASVLLGTLYPLALDALNLGKISVGPPYFEAIFVPLMTPVVVLMAAAPFLRWKGHPLPPFLRKVLPGLVASLIVGSLVAWAMGALSWRSALGLALAFWVLIASAMLLRERLAERPSTSYFTRLRGIPLAWWGMWFAHLGIGFFIIGVTMVKSLEASADVKMQVGETTTMAGYSFVLRSVEDVHGPNYTASRARVELKRDGIPISTLYPEKRIYTADQTPTTNASIDTGLFRDVYVSLGDPVANDGWIVRLYYKPFVSWIWFGSMMMAFGGMLAAMDKRYRRLAERHAAKAAAAVAAA